MAVQKSKTSKQRTNTRFSANSKLSGVTLVECPQCHELTVPHKVCKHCGYYNGREVVAKKDEKKD
ncbi:MAG: 50S ribosomal protein L32 [Clostridia bacterium]|nr:50S ribosomal protein L32 [Clostridia bacterium]